MSDARIIETVGGEQYCEGCYDDIMTPADRASLAVLVNVRLTNGVCGCCDAVVVAGNYVDPSGESVI